MIVEVLSRNSYHRSMKAIVSEKGQVTIPKPLRDRLGLRPGQVLRFREEKGVLVASKESGADPVARSYGILKTGAGSDALVRKLRGKADGV